MTKERKSSYKVWNGLTPGEWDQYDFEDFAGSGEEFKKVLEGRKLKAKEEKVEVKPKGKKKK